GKLESKATVGYSIRDDWKVAPSGLSLPTPSGELWSKSASGAASCASRPLRRLPRGGAHLGGARNVPHCPPALALRPATRHDDRPGGSSVSNNKGRQAHEEACIRFPALRGHRAAGVRGARSG